MPRQFHQCYQLVPILPAGTHLGFNMHYSSEKGYITIGPHFRLTGMDGAAHLATLELAERARTALLPRFQKRYGPETDIEVRECGGQWLERIEKDSAIVQARLDQGVFAPNKRPVMA